MSDRAHDAMMDLLNEWDLWAWAVGYLERVAELVLSRRARRSDGNREG
jgi:hypothetical protein